MADILDKGIVKVARFSKLNNRINYFKEALKVIEYSMSLERYVRKIKIDRLQFNFQFKLKKAVLLKIFQQYCFFSFREEC